MKRILLITFFIFLIAVSTYAYQASQRTFQAKFKNIDGLPKGAQVTASGVKIGEVIKTKSVYDGILVTVRITNKNFPLPSPGSQLVITSFRPNQGRVLEVIPQDEISDKTKAWIIQEPITTESWLHAALNLLESLKTFSQIVVKHVTPENFEKARLLFKEASVSLNDTAGRLQKYEENLFDVKEKFSKKASEANLFIIKLKKPIESLNKIVNDKNATASFKNDLKEISGNLNHISEKVQAPDFYQMIVAYKAEILENLNQINNTIAINHQNIKNSTLKNKIKDFNEHLIHLRAFYSNIDTNDLKKIKTVAKRAREITEELAGKTKQN